MALKSSCKMTAAAFLKPLITVAFSPYSFAMPTIEACRCRRRYRQLFALFKHLEAVTQRCDNVNKVALVKLAYLVSAVTSYLKNKADSTLVLVDIANRDRSAEEKALCLHLCKLSCLCRLCNVRTVYLNVKNSFARVFLKLLGIYPACTLKILPVLSSLPHSERSPHQKRE